MGWIELTLAVGLRIKNKSKEDIISAIREEWSDSIKKPILSSLRLQLEQTERGPFQSSRNETYCPDEDCDYVKDDTFLLYFGCLELDSSNGEISQYTRYISDLFI